MGARGERGYGGAMAFEVGSPTAPVQVSQRRPRLLLRVAAAALLAAALAVLRSDVARAVEAGLARVHPLVVDAVRAATAAGLRGWAVRRAGPFAVYYLPGDGRDAAVAAAAVARLWPEVARDFDLAPDAGHGVVVVAPPATMARVGGTPRADPPLGAYADGVVWLLAPSAALGPDPTVAAYVRSGTVAHELTHLADDLVADGRTPAWLDEGLAQYEAWRLTGYVWQPPAAELAGPPYPWAELTRDWARLPDVALAYRQALEATAAVCRARAGACLAVLRDLRDGWSVEAAVAAAAGHETLARLEAGAAWSGPPPAPGGPAGPPP